MSKLLPTNHEEFHTRDYWDKFFAERGNEAFEWYGTYNEMRSLLDQQIPSKEAAILAIGCGNSEFSHNIYDAGYDSIHNLDYSQVVIDEMKAKNSKNGKALRPSMHWDLGDMTNMPSYTSGQFDVVFDKGALDALMSTDTEDIRDKAKKMFNEIKRVVKPHGGKYICVTLAEKYILETLLSYFCDARDDNRWIIQVETFKPVQNSPFCPIVMCLTSVNNVATTSNAANANILCRIDASGKSITKPDRMTPVAFKAHVLTLQEFSQNTFKNGDLGEMRIGRFDTFELWAAEASSAADDDDTKDIPRFTIIVVDASLDASRIGCAVFFVPQGSESHYQFSTQGGLEGIAELANCRRLIAVRCNRPHNFPKDPKLLQDELDPMMGPLMPTNKKADEQVPYVAIPDDGRWEIISKGFSTLSGRFIVEEGAGIAMEDEDEQEISDKTISRRLVFLQNQHFVQTEVRLRTIETLSLSSANEINKAALQKYADAKNWSLESVEGFGFDPAYLDEHHRAALAAFVMMPNVLDSASGSGLLVGLGGGAFAMALQRMLPSFQLYVCDIDPRMQQVACEHFGYIPTGGPTDIDEEGKPSAEEVSRFNNNNNNNNNSNNTGRGGQGQEARTIFLGGDGVTAIQQARGKCEKIAESEEIACYSLLPTTPLNYVFLDVDSKDPSLTLSAPPKEFAKNSTLEDIHAILVPGGVLVVNIVARTEQALQQFQQAVAKVFSISAASVVVEGETDSARDLIRAAIEGGGELDLEMLSTGAGAGSDDINVDEDIDDDIDDDGVGSSANNNNANDKIGETGITATMWLVEAEEDVVNRTLICCKAGGSVSSVESRNQSLKNWLSGQTEGKDVLNFHTVLDSIQPVKLY